MPYEVLIVRRRKRNQPRTARFSLMARAPRPGAPAAITVTVQLGRNGWTRLVTASSPAEFAAALAPDLSHLSRDVWGTAS
jgi:hypothetical protein